MAVKGSTPLEQLLLQYSTGVPGTLQGANQFVTGRLAGTDTGQVPGFSDIYENFSANVERQGKRASASLSEAFGSRGGRYSSDLLRAQGDLQGEISERLIGGASDIRQARANETATLAGAGIATAGAETAINEAAFQRMFIDFLRRTAPPPLLQSLLGFSGNLQTGGQPATIVS